ncbi:hypothetical protein COV16_07280 [Candidatus Woesearchaeota archaeon CG10_big_fil_rev_8_21_14_0_10_34_8]|nr:MAG: hypothetical protein COV16_07280 [Candidatus Woesearchaeota archaeon CG10_big_fil_rev_8_21_14_0_10_34_8]
MKLPTRQQAESYFDKYKVPNNVKLHCFKVNKVSVFLAEKLIAKGENINLEIVDRLSLLHDIFKAIVIDNLEKPSEKFNYQPDKEKVEFWNNMKITYKGMHETQLFYELFKDEFPEFSELVYNFGKHSIFTSGKTREEQITHYADWRVFLDDIVPLKERIDDLFRRYNGLILSKGKELWDKRIADELKVESSIFSKLDISPADLKELIQ